MSEVNVVDNFQHFLSFPIREAVRLELGWTYSNICQMGTYTRLYSKQKKGHDDNPAIGLVLCSEKSEAVVKYSVLAENQKLFAAKYLPYLPSGQELKQELERERARVVAQLAKQEVGDGL